MTEIILLKFLKALRPIKVTLYADPLYITFSGTTTSVIELSHPITATVFPSEELYFIPSTAKSTDQTTPMLSADKSKMVNIFFIAF